MFSAKYKKEIQLTVHLAIPIIIAQLGVVLMGVADNIMVGRILGKTALGVSGLANSIAFMIGSIAVGGMAAVAPLVSKANAENNPERIHSLFRALLWVALGFSILLTAISLFAAQNFHFFGQPENINRLAGPFLTIISLSNIPLFLFVAAKQLSDGLGFTKVAMVITILGLGTNVVLNYLFMDGAGIMESMGVLGAAYATLLTRIVMMFAMLWYVRYHKRFAHYFQPAYFQASIKDLVRYLFKLSIPGGFQFFFEIAAFAIAVIMMGWIGENELAAHQVAINIASTFYMMASGIAFAGGIRVGDGRGLKSIDHIRTSGNVAVGLVTAFMTLTMLSMIFFDKQFISLYLNDQEVTQIATKLLFIAAVFQLSDGLQVVALGNLRGLSDITIPTVITFVAYWVIALPMGYILAFPLHFGAAGVWYGLLAGLTASAILLLLRFYQLIRKGVREEAV